METKIKHPKKYVLNQLKHNWKNQIAKLSIQLLEIVQVSISEV